jgi:pSer/pThr/pTyr-binding forkhead associated (FHA) protein
MLVYLRLANGKQAGTSYYVWKSPFIIGRHQDADLRIGDERVSVYHACVLLRDNEVWVRDMDSTNGTKVNDEPLTDERRLGIGDKIQVGPAVFEVLQKASGVLRLDDRDEYSTTSPALPSMPKTDKHKKPLKPQ